MERGKQNLVHSSLRVVIVIILFGGFPICTHGLPFMVMEVNRETYSHHPQK